MIGRLRTLLERPLDAEVARWVVVLALAVTIGMTGVVGLSARGGDRTRLAALPRTDAVHAPARPPQTAHRHVAARRQDPQDRAGTAAHRRAARELAAHRGLQHVPWRADGVSISLVGARGGKAVLAVSGPGPVAESRAWRAFLRRFDDDGSAYLPRFRVSGGRRVR